MCGDILKTNNNKKLGTFTPKESFQYWKVSQRYFPQYKDKIFSEETFELSAELANSHIWLLTLYFFFHSIFHFFTYLGYTILDEKPFPRTRKNFKNGNTNTNEKQEKLVCQAYFICALFFRWGTKKQKLVGMGEGTQMFHHDTSQKPYSKVPILGLETDINYPRYLRHSASKYFPSKFLWLSCFSCINGGLPD